jgi:hypothetical protein
VTISEWAMVKNGRVVNVITTSSLRSRAELRRKYPGYDMVPVHSLPPSALDHYEYWDKRP